MKTLAVAVLGTLLVGLAPAAAQAGGAVHAAVALGTFAVLAPFLVLGALAQPFVYAPPPAVYPAPATYASAPAYPVAAYAPAVRQTAPRPPAVTREVVYAQGRHVLLGDGVTSPYQWVWVPNPPAGAPPAPPR
jgi:hypothetical protein